MIIKYKFKNFLEIYWILERLLVKVITIEFGKLTIFLVALFVFVVIKEIISFSTCLYLYKTTGDIGALDRDIAEVVCFTLLLVCIYFGINLIRAIKMYKRINHKEIELYVSSAEMKYVDGKIYLLDFKKSFVMNDEIIVLKKKFTPNTVKNYIGLIPRRMCSEYEFNLLRSFIES